MIGTDGLLSVLRSAQVQAKQKALPLPEQILIANGLPPVAQKFARRLFLCQRRGKEDVVVAIPNSVT